MVLAAEPAGQATAVNYGRPFEPPTRPAFIPLPPGAVEPAGWLRDWARTARDGYTGHMEDVAPAFKQAWAADYKMTGEALTYWDKGAWPYEGGGYWFDGLTKLAYALHDEALIAKARACFDPVLDNMNADVEGGGAGGCGAGRTGEGSAGQVRWARAGQAGASRSSS